MERLWTTEEGGLRDISKLSKHIFCVNNLHAYLKYVTTLNSFTLLSISELQKILGCNAQAVMGNRLLTQIGSVF